MAGTYSKLYADISAWTMCTDLVRNVVLFPVRYASQRLLAPKITAEDRSAIYDSHTAEQLALF